MDDVSAPDPGGVEGSRGLPGIVAEALRLEDRPGGHEDAAAGQCRRIGEAAEGRILGLHLEQPALAQDGKPRKRVAAVNTRRVDAVEPAGKAWRNLHRLIEKGGQPGEQIALPRRRITGFQFVEMRAHRPSRQFGRVIAIAGTARKGPGQEAANAAPRIVRKCPCCAGSARIAGRTSSCSSSARATPGRN